MIPSLRCAPVGIFDSGLGGLSVLRDIRQRLPGEALIYIADSLHAPYGEKASAFIQTRTLALTEWLLAQGAKALVIACNTATTHAIHLLRERHPQLPLVGVEPGLKPAAALSRNKIVGVLATANTLASDKFRVLLAAQDPQCRFICQAGTGLVARIEAGDIDSPEVEALLRRHLHPMLDAHIDTLVLGCTHYPFLIPAIRRIVGAEMMLIDTGEAVARRLAHQLQAHGLLAPVKPPSPPTRYCSTFGANHLQTMLTTLLHVPGTAETVQIN